jgi:type II secretory pathway component PulF
MKEIDPAEKEEALARFRAELEEEVEKGIDHHESSMTRMGFLFLSIFIGVIALAALLP